MNEEYHLITKKIRDMISYNNSMVLHFPKYEKYLLANKIRELGYQLFELAIAVNKRIIKKTTLTDLNIKHELLRQLVNLSFELKYINLRKHRICQYHIDEIGKMIGSWIKNDENKG